MAIDRTDRKKAEDELNSRVEELEQFYNMAISREIKMKELKERIKELESEVSKLKD
jgi:polyhydroxyalkanoate synthesis regulator phasin